MDWNRWGDFEDKNLGENRVLRPCNTGRVDTLPFFNLGYVYKFRSMAKDGT